MYQPTIEAEDKRKSFCPLFTAFGLFMSTLKVRRDGATCGLENARVALAVALSEGLHHSVDLLSFSR